VLRYAVRAGRDMAFDEKIVTISASCRACGNAMEIDCVAIAGTAHRMFCRVDCPHCGATQHPKLPGAVDDVLLAGERDEQVARLDRPFGN
jgi:hypothetical protein